MINSGSGFGEVISDALNSTNIVNKRKDEIRKNEFLRIGQVKFHTFNLRYSLILFIFKFKFVYFLLEFKIANYHQRRRANKSINYGSS